MNVHPHRFKNFRSFIRFFFNFVHVFLQGLDALLKDKHVSSKHVEPTKNTGKVDAEND